MEIYDFKIMVLLYFSSVGIYKELLNFKCLKECIYIINIYNVIGIKIVRSKLNYLNICIN